MIGTVLAGKYRIIDMVGTGGMAMVYLGEHIPTGRRVAIKRLKPEHMRDEQIVRRFETETRIALTYSHKNIVKTYEVLFIDGIHYIVMEYVDGHILSDYIAQRRRLDVDEIVMIGKQVCNALFYAHSHRLIHRDIKPQNVMINREGVVKVVDFGIAKAPISPDTTVQSDEALGSVHYISPEQAQGNAVDEKTDIYSMGVVLYEMTTGEVPFHGKTPVEVALKQVREEPRPPSVLRPDVPPALERVILKAMSKEERYRYDNAREMARDIERILAEPDGRYVKLHDNTHQIGSTRLVHKITDVAQQSMHPQGRVPAQVTRDTASRRQSFTGANSRVTAKRKQHGMGLGMKLFIGIGATLAAIAIVFVVLGTVLSEPRRVQVTVPSLIGYPQAAAEMYLNDAGLLWEVHPAEDTDYDAGVVAQQYPEGLSMLDKGKTVMLYISTGPANVETPRLLELDEAQARQRAEEHNLIILSTRYEESTKLEGTVIRQSPEPGEKIKTGDGVTIWIARAPSRQEELRMGDYVGMERSNAVRALTDMSIFALLQVDDDSRYPKDAVVRQDPEPGALLSPDQQVTLWYSDGYEAQYRMERAIPITVTEENTRVRVVYTDGEREIVMLNYTYEPGDHTIILDLETDVIDDKTVTVYFNDTLVNENTFRFHPDN